MYSLEEVRAVDPEIAAAIEAEMNRQNSHIELIASENWVSKAVMAAMGSPLTNKYAEGYSGKRYYGGCECVDVVENLAIERAKKIFGCEYVNVQPHSGAQANMAVQFAMLKPGDTIMGQNLAHGGHLTHGSPANFSGTYFNVVPYGVNDDGVLDYDEIRRIALECKPKMIIAGASAYARTLNFKRFREIADEVGAYLMVDIAHIAGLVAAGLHPSPIPYAHVTTTTTHKTLRGPRGGMIMSDAETAKKFNFNKAVFPGIQGGPLMHVIAAKAVCFEEALKPEYKEYQAQVVKNAQALCKGLMDRGIKIVSGGTDNHLMLVDLTPFDLTGKDVEHLLDAANITANKNTIPNDPKSAFVTSGIRIGTPAVTSRGLKEEDMETIAEAVALMIKEGESATEKAKALVKSFDGFRALDGLDLTVPKGAVYGLVGPNGAGKSTLIRHAVGIYRQDSGELLVDGEPVYENPKIKARIAYIPDEVAYFTQSTIKDMMRFYKSIYPAFDRERFEKLGRAFELSLSRPLRKMSKGMQKQAAFWLALSCRPDCIILDEPVDGLDPVMRRQVWNLLLGDVAERGSTVLVSSHNLRELEDVCDHVGIMNRGKMLLERSLSQLQDNMVKVQLALADGTELPESLDILHCSVTGRLRQLILRGDAEEVTNKLSTVQPLFMDVLPLSLEEIFIYELGGAEHEIKDILV